LGESRTKVNHVGIVVEGGAIEEAVVVEALSRVKRHRLVTRYGSNGKDEVAIYRPLNIPGEDIAAIVRKAETYVGCKYDYSEVLLHLADWFLLGAYVFRRLGRMNPYPICSWVVADAYSNVGKDFGVPAGAASPDDIWDFVNKHPEKYELVYPLGPLVAEG